MPALGHERAQRAGGQWRKVDRLQLGGDTPRDEGHQAGRFRRRHRLGQQPQREAGQIGAALAVAQPVGNEGAEIDLAQLGIDGRGFEKMHLDEFAELVGNAMLVALDDRGMRDRQSQRPAKQRHHRIPVGQSADGRGFRERRDEAERRMHRQQQLRRHEQRQRARQHQSGQQLDAPQFGRARGIAGRVERECGGDGHGGFRDERKSSSLRNGSSSSLEKRRWAASRRMMGRSMVRDRRHRTAQVRCRESASSS